ncbi:MAG: hypothetical protein AAF366_22430 [Pseudomonadota bacterium]
MLFASLLSLFGLGAMLWLLVACAIYALPAFVGLNAALHLHAAQVDGIAVIGGGLLAGVLTLLVGQVLIALVRHPLLQCAIASLYAAPAALAGYHAVHGLSGLSITSEPIRITLAIIGAVLVGAAAWGRMGDPLDGGTPPGDPSGAKPAQSR